MMFSNMWLFAVSLVILLAPCHGAVIRKLCSPQVRYTNSSGPHRTSAINALQRAGNDSVRAAFERVSTMQPLNPVKMLPASRRPFSTSGPGQFCIDFTFDNPNWHYTRQPPWGSDTGTFNSLENGRMCVPTHNGHGGAIFIGPYPNPAANNTKLECYFPNSGVANCDISLVDGFSLPVTCTMGQLSMGGNIDLWDTAAICENEASKHLGICTNTREDVAEANVPKFFQPAIRSGNSYCIWTKCTQNPFFPIDTEVKCHVGSTRLSPPLL